MLFGSAVGAQLVDSPRSRHLWFYLLIFTTIVWFWEPLVSIFTLSLNEGQSGYYSYIVLIPFLSVYLVYLGRKSVFAAMDWSPFLGLPLIGLGVVFSRSVTVSVGEERNFLPLAILTIVLICWGVFLLCYGIKAFQSAFFGLSLLLFIVPLPAFLLEAIIEFLRGGTAEGVDFLFQLFRVPVFRQDVVFTLSNISIEIAKECSGIRSSLALLICSLVAGHLFLRSPWTRLAIVVIVIPLAITKNSIRIVVLSLLGNYVDSGFLTDSALHHRGGIPLFFVSLVVLLGILWVLRWSERSSQNRSSLVS